MVATNVLWPSHHENALRAHMGSGSFVQVTALMNAQLGTAYTRNAVIGKAKRMGLTTKIPPGQRTPINRKPKPRAVPVKPARLSPNSPEAVTLRCVEVEPRNLTIYQLTDDTCRWPYGDAAPFTFCGHLVFEGSYCAAHFYLSTRN